MKAKSSVLVIYTGGTIGMVQDVETGLFKPFDFDHLLKQIPELKNLDIILSTIAFKKPIDSSNIQPKHWIQIAEIIEDEYLYYDGFVVLHGSDTMAYTASALSFMLQNLNKPVIITGSQIPLGVVRTDGKENLITAIEIAGDKKNGKPIVPEVAIYFEYQLLRGNRSYKHSAEYFDAFRSDNYHKLAEAGIRIQYKTRYIREGNDKTLIVRKSLNENVAILKLFPGISEKVVTSFLSIESLEGVVMETFGSGNATTQKWFIDCLKKAIEGGLMILNVTQCNGGSVEQGRYETSSSFEKIGVIDGADLTTEAAITKMMFLLGQNLDKDNLKKYLTTPIREEMTLMD